MTQKELTESQAKIIEELIATEESYQRGLLTLKEVYTTPLIKDPELTGPEWDGLKSFFAALEPIIMHSEYLLENLQELRKNLTNPDITTAIQELQSIFKTFGPSLKVYKIYIDRFHTNILNQALDNETFSQKCKTIQHAKALNKGIGDYAITPIQRIMRYPLLLAELLRNISENTQPEAHKAIKATLKIVEDATKGVNKSLFSDDPEYYEITVQTIEPGQKSEILSPIEMKAAWEQYQLELAKIEKATQTKLTMQQKQALYRARLKKRSDPIQTQTRIPIQLAEDYVKGTPAPPATVPAHEPPVAAIVTVASSPSALAQAQDYYKTRENRTCEKLEKLGVTTLKIDITDVHRKKTEPELTYYIEEEQTDPSKLIYQAPLSNDNKYNAALIKAACEDAADAAIKNARENKIYATFDFSTSPMPNDIKKLMQETFQEKLNAAAATEEFKEFKPFSINVKLITELEERLRTPLKGLKTTPRKDSLR